MALDDAIEIILEVLAIYYEERDYQLYVNSLIFMKTPLSFEEFRNKKKPKKKKEKKISEKEKEKRKKENDKILSLFNDEKKYNKGVNLFE